MRKEQINKLVKMGLLCAIAVILAYLVRFPIFPSAPFLEYDMADVPILIGTFLYGPAAGLLMTVVVSVIQGLTVSASSGWVGIAMHIFATGAFVLTAGLIYKKYHSLKGAVIALISGAIALTLMMIPLNLIFTVHFLGAPRQVVIDMLAPIIIPFNLIKGFGNSIITFIIYKTVSRIFKREFRHHKHQNTEE